MVNKQYNVNKTKNHSPPPLRSHPVVSSQPNPLSSLQSNGGGNGGHLKENNVEFLSEEVKQNVYGRNIAFYNNSRDAVRDDINDDKNINYNNDRLSVKDLTISDIGRFQYILQMDREMVSLGDFSVMLFVLSNKMKMMMIIMLAMMICSIYISFKSLNCISFYAFIFNNHDFFLI